MLEPRYMLTPTLASYAGMGGVGAFAVPSKASLEDLRKKYGLADAKKKAEQVVTAQARELLQKQGEAAADKFLRGTGKAMIRDAGERMSASAAKAYGQEFMRGMKIPSMPDIPFALPTELTVDGVEKAAYNTAKAYTENLIKQKIGVPIELPRKLSVKEISRTVDSIVPNNAREALDLTLSIGAQAAAGAAASALTGVLAATAIGSVVPGLGTLVGLGVGLATVALKGAITAAFTETACEHNKAMCKCKTPPGWRRPDPGKRSPVELLPWLADELHKLYKIQLEPKLCGIGEVPETMNWFGTLTTLVTPYVNSSLPVMGLPALERILPAYERAATLARTGPGYSHQGDPGGVIKYGVPASRDGLGFVKPAVPAPLAVIKSRIAFLKKLASDADNIGKGGDLSGLRWNLATELHAATRQYGMNPSADNEAWFVKLGTAFAALEDEEERRRVAMIKDQKKSEALAKARLSSDVGALWKAHDDRQQAMFLCDEAGGADRVPNDPNCLAVKAAEKKIIDLHRQGLKLPPQPKGSGTEYFERIAAAEAEKLGPLPGERRGPSAVAPKTFADYERMLREVVAEPAPDTTFADYTRMLRAAASGFLQEDIMKVEIGRAPHGGHHGGHHGGGHHHHHHHGRRPLGGGGYYDGPAYFGPVYDWPIEPQVVVVVDPTAASAPLPADETPPPADVPEDVAAVSGLAARYAHSPTYQEALRAARGVLKGGPAQRQLVLQILERAKHGDLAAQRFLRYWPLAAKHARLEAPASSTASGMTAISGCIDGPPGSRSVPPGAMAASGLSYASHDVLAAGRAAMAARHMGRR
jgi:hypothetical protein